jgi:hypothetical protein
MLLLINSYVRVGVHSMDMHGIGVHDLGGCSMDMQSVDVHCMGMHGMELSGVDTGHAENMPFLQL